MPIHPGILLSTLLLVACLSANIVLYPEVRDMISSATRSSGDPTEKNKAAVQEPTVESFFRQDFSATPEKSLGKPAEKSMKKPEMDASPSNGTTNPTGKSSHVNRPILIPDTKPSDANSAAKTPPPIDASNKPSAVHVPSKPKARNRIVAESTDSPSLPPERSTDFTKSESFPKQEKTVPPPADWSAEKSNASPRQTIPSRNDPFAAFVIGDSSPAQSPPQSSASTPPVEAGKKPGASNKKPAPDTAKTPEKSTRNPAPVAETPKPVYANRFSAEQPGNDPERNRTGDTPSDKKPELKPIGAETEPLTNKAKLPPPPVWESIDSVLQRPMMYDTPKSVIPLPPVPDGQPASNPQHQPLKPLEIKEGIKRLPASESRI